MKAMKHPDLFEFSNYRSFMKAYADGADIIVKVDGDGQIDPQLIPQIVSPLLLKQADYVKGNRFYHAASLPAMPKVRLIGNLGLSFLTKISTGYWDQVDPTNGFVAISAPLVPLLEIEKISNIRISIVDPGATRTAMRERAYPGEDPNTVKSPDVVAERLVSLLQEDFQNLHEERVDQAG